MRTAGRYYAEVERGAMSKKVLVQQIQPDANGPTFGEVANPADFQKSQIFAHNHAEILARDYVVGACATTIIAGFEHSLPGGMAFRILAPGHILEPDGRSYELIGAEQVDLVLAQADAGLPRIDLVIATIEADANAADESRPFVRIRTLDELTVGVAPYPPTNFDQPTELHNRATVSIKPGMPANPPAAPALGDNERALYAVSLPAAVNFIGSTNVTDLRHLVGSLCVLQDALDQLRKDLSGPPSKHGHMAIEVGIGPSAGEPWPGQSVQAFIDFWSRFSVDVPTDPLTRPETLTSNGKLGASANLDGAIPVCDIPAGLRVAFSDRVITLEPGRFPASSSPRLFNNAVGSGASNNTLPLSMGILSSIESDGGGDWVQQSDRAPSKRTWPAACGLDSTRIACFGGGGATGKLSDFFVYDTVTDTHTTVVLTGNVPQPADRPALFTCGDDVNLSLVTPSSGEQLPKWYLINADTGAAVLKNTGPQMFGGQNLVGFLGDLISPNNIFIIAQGHEGNATP